MRIAAAITFTLVITVGGAAARSGHGCASAGKTVIRNSVARIYEQSPHVYACWLPHARRVRLDAGPSRWRLANVKGQYAAVAFDRAGSAAALVWVKLGAHPESRVAYTFPEGRPHPPAAHPDGSPRGAGAVSATTALGDIAPP